KTTEALNAAGIEYAVVGGNAVAAWVATIDPNAIRSTTDVDLLARREIFPPINDVLVKNRVLPVQGFPVHMFVERDDSSPKRGVRVVIANERIRSHYEHAAPDPGAAVRNIADYPVVDLADLVAMKLQSNRDIDRAHITDLKGVGLITDQLA